MVPGQHVLSSLLDVAALNRVEHRLFAAEAVRGQAHAEQLQAALEADRIHRAAGHPLNTAPQVALVLGCSEHRATVLLADARLLVGLPGAIEAVECGLLPVEQSRRLVDALDPLPVDQRLSVWQRLQAQLVDSSTPLPPERLAELLRRWISQTDPAGATARRCDAEERRAVDYRRRTTDSLTDLYLLGLTGPDAQACLQNIRRNAAPHSSHDTRTADQRHLDAARDLLLGRSPLPFDEQHCRSGCDCRPGQPAPCGMDMTVLVPLGAALGTTDETAELAGHGPIEPDLLADLLLASPELRAVFVDEHGVPVADSPRVERPPRNDPAALRAALLRLAKVTPGPHRPRHLDDHLPPPPDTGPPDTGPPDTGPPEAPTPPEGAPPTPESSSISADLKLLRQIGARTRAAADAARPVVLTHPHPTDTPGHYRPSRRLARFLQARSPRCEWPGCGARAARCDLDHDLAWPFGPTCPCNVGPLCRRHHRVKQQGWIKLRARDATLRWTSPSGKTWTSRSQHQPPQRAVRPLPALPVPDPLDELSPTAREHEQRHLDPTDPRWDDPAGYELRADDLEPDEPDVPDDTRWTHDLDDPYAWHDLTEVDSS